MDRATGSALTVNARLGSGELALYLVELGIGLLQLGGSPSEHIETVVVANRHFVGEPAQNPLQHRHALGQLGAAAVQVVGGKECERSHQPPVSIGWAPSLLISSSCFLPDVSPSF